MTVIPQSNDGSLSHSLQSANMLDVSNLTVSLQGKTILENINFKVKRATVLSIVGPNGSGKTTLFRALLNMVPYSGAIKWNDNVRIGYVPQSLLATDLPITVKDFLQFKCKEDAQ